MSDKNIDCPYCKSDHTIGDSAPMTSLGDSKYDIEQLILCLDCEKPFAIVSNEIKSIPIEESTRFS